MTQKIQLRRGTAADLPDGGTIEGEPRFTTDTGLLYIDDGTNNILIGGKTAGYELDALAAYGSGTSYTDATITSALTALGTTDKATLLLSPGTWVFDEDIDYSAYTNITFKLPPGALISHGAYTLNIPNIEAGLYQIFTGAGAVTLSGRTTVAYPEWFGTNTTPGTTDMTSALQYAITALSSGGVVKLSTTTYAYTYLTITTANITLEGEGWGSILSSTNAVTGDTPTNLLVQANGVQLKNFKTTWKTLPSALVISGDWVIENNVIGIGVNPTVANTYYYDIVIDHVYVLGGKTHGICLGRTENVIIKDCRVEGVWGTGIWGTYARRSNIINNYVTETEDAGIDITSNGTVAGAAWVDGSDIIIRGNRLVRVAYGIGVHGADNSIVDGNIINTTYGVSIRASDDTAGGHTTPGRVSITNNHIIDPWTLYGAGETQADDIYTTVSGTHGAIEAWTDDELIISHNTIYDAASLTTGYRALYVGGKHMTINGNNIETDAATAIALGGATNATVLGEDVDYLSITGNIVVDTASTYGIILNGIASGIITGNILETAGTVVYSLYSGDVLLEANNIQSYTTLYTDAAGSKNIVFRNNIGAYDIPTSWPTNNADKNMITDGDGPLTIAVILKGIIEGTPTGARSYELPTGTLCDANGYFALYQWFDWSLVNLASATHAITLTVGTDHTIVGSPTISAATSARFRTQKTATNTFITYRIG